jgi:hypothetical protein
MWRELEKQQGLGNCHVNNIALTFYYE